MDDEKEMQINAWVTENRVLRMVVNPFKPYQNTIQCISI